MALAKLADAVEELGRRPAASPIVVASGPSRRFEAAAPETSNRAVPANASATASAPHGAGPEEPARTYEQERALETAKQRFASLVSAGRANQQDLMDLRSALGQAASPTEAFELQRQMAVEVNMGRLVLEPGTF